MNRFSRNLMIAVLSTLSLLVILLVGSVYSAWRTSEAARDNYAEKILEKEDFPDYARAILLQMNNLLLLREIRPSEAEDIRASFDELGSELENGLALEESILPESIRQKIITRIRADVGDYLDSARAFLNSPPESGVLAVRIEQLQPIREKSDHIIPYLREISDNRDEELQSVFHEYESAQSKLFLLIVVLTVTSLLLSGSTAVIILKNRVSSLRLDLTRAKLQQEKQERLASLGTLASGVAHEIRNPLTAIKARLFTLAKRIPVGSDAERPLVEVEKEISRLEKLVTDFLLFARPAKPSAEPMEVSHVLAQVSKLLKEEFLRSELNITVIPVASESVIADPEQVEQILINLILNAADASQPGDTITLSTRQLNSGLNGHAEFLAVDVTDTGSGIPTEIAKHIFNPFFTTKPKGTGLGLSISKRIAQANQGDLSFETREGKGTTFSLILPKVS